jgi:hypothetical protein
MEQRIEHPVGPLQLAARERAHPLEDLVPVALTLRKDCEYERCRRRGDQVLVDVRAGLPELEVLCIEAQCT